MGTWGTGIFSNDTACDVRDMYRDFLACGYDDVKAENAVIEYWVPQVSGTEEEAVFWIALAVIEHKYGRLSDETKKMALNFIEHDMENMDDWRNDQKSKRRAALKKAALTLELPSEKKKIPPMRGHSTKWKKGDIILASIGTVQNDESFFAMQVFDVINVPCSSFIQDGPVNQVPVVGIYCWIGKKFPVAYELIQHRFIKRKGFANRLPSVICFVTTERECKKYNCSVVENNRMYLEYINEEQIKQQMGGTWGGFKSSIANLQYQIQKGKIE